MNIVILDDWERTFVNHPAIHKLRGCGKVTLYHDRPQEEELVHRLREADIVIPLRERTRFTRELLQQIAPLRLIAQTGSGVAHIDKEAAKELSIPIATTTGGSSSVVELIFGFMLAYSRQLVLLHQKMKDGVWTESVGKGLAGKTLGVIGLGNVGSGSARAAKAFGMRVLAWGPRLTEERAAVEGVDYAPFEKLLKESDYIAICVRLVPETRNLIQREHFSLMKPDAFLINTSRGEIVEEEALIGALRERRIGGAGLDVFHKEPLLPGHPLLSLDNVLLSPHIGWKTDAILNQFLTEAAVNIIAFLDSNPSR